jgi:hypothetical protein
MMTYTRCEMCRGSLSRLIDGGDRDDERDYYSCPCATSSTPGWMPTGLTLAQIDRMVELERALQGDPGIPIERRVVVLINHHARLKRVLESTSITIPGRDPEKPT